MPEEEFLDASSSYWAPGRNLERQAGAKEDDLATLRESELVKSQGGLSETRVNIAMNRLSRNMSDVEQDRKQKKKRRANKKHTPEGITKGPVASSSTGNAQKRAIWAPEWLKTWRKHFKGQQWGFVIFRAACYSGNDEDEQRWARFKEQVQRIVELPFEREVIQATQQGQTIPKDFNEARAKFTIWWEEEVLARQGSTTAITSADPFRSKYAALKPSLEPGMSWRVFLYASPEAVESFEKEAPHTNEESYPRRPRAPFLLAVTAKNYSYLDDYEIPRLKPVFKIAAEALVEPFFSVLNTGTPLRRMTRYVKGTNELGGVTDRWGSQERLNEIWWSSHPPPTTTKYCKGNESPEYWENEEDVQMERRGRWLSSSGTSDQRRQSPFAHPRSCN